MHFNIFIFLFKFCFKFQEFLNIPENHFENKTTKTIIEDLLFEFKNKLTILYSPKKTEIPFESFHKLELENNQNNENSLIENAEIRTVTLEKNKQKMIITKEVKLCDKQQHFKGKKNMKIRTDMNERIVTITRFRSPNFTTKRNIKEPKSARSCSNHSSNKKKTSGPE